MKKRTVKAMIFKVAGAFALICSFGAAGAIDAGTVQVIPGAFLAAVCFALFGVFMEASDV